MAHLHCGSALVAVFCFTETSHAHENMNLSSCVIQKIKLEETKKLDKALNFKCETVEEKNGLACMEASFCEKEKK